LRLPAAWRVNLSVALLAVVFSVYLAEASVRIVNWVRTPDPAPECERRTLSEGQTRPLIAIGQCHAAHAAGLPYDTRGTLDVQDDLRGDGITAYPTISPRFLITHHVRVHTPAGEVTPLGAIGNVTSIFCNESGQWVVYESDEHGYRNPRGLYQPGADAVLLGDSFTQGQCVADNDTFADRIRRVLPRTVNLGYSANGPLLALASFMEYAVPLRPRVVLWFFFEGNDINNLEIEKEDPVLTAYLDGHIQHLTQYQAEIDRDLTDFAENARREAIANLADWQERQARREAEVEPPPSLRSNLVVRFALATELRRLVQHSITTARETPEATIVFDQELFRRMLSRVKETTESWGGTFQMVYLPEWKSVAAGTPQNPHYHRVLEIAEEVGVPVIDVLSAFSAEPDPLDVFALHRPVHYAPRAHQLIADVVLKAIR
jgi:hypothetical protein